jgi:hypothetical protein
MRLLVWRSPSSNTGRKVRAGLCAVETVGVFRTVSSVLRSHHPLARSASTAFQSPASRCTAVFAAASVWSASAGEGERTRVAPLVLRWFPAGA